MAPETISIIGLGYIGLPTAAILAARGCDVIGVDVDADTVATVNRGEIHIIELDLEGLVSRVVRNGNLRATTVPEPADAFIITVPTPLRAGNHPDLGFVERAARSIAPVLKAGDLVVLESTSPVGATEQLAGWLAEERPDLRFPSADTDGQTDVAIAYCPERVLPGNIIHELVHNDRVIGGLSPACSLAAASLYGRFVQGECIVTDARTAEMCKLTENSFRDVNIAFANELSMICDRLGINPWELIALANRHPRVNILKPGPGVGGHCIAVDPWFIVHSCPEEARLIERAREVNLAKPRHVVERIRAAIGRAVERSAAKDAGAVTVACFGLSFKADIDDLRESPATDIVGEIAGFHQGPLLAVEPHIRTLPPSLAERGVRLVEASAALDQADVVVLLVDHSAFKTVSKSLLADKIVVDTRGFWTSRDTVEAQLRSRMRRAA